jgi:hypothetical protein
LETAASGQARVERQHRKQIVALQVFVIGEDFIDRHTGAEEFKERLHRITKPADAGLAVTYARIERDSRK